MFRVWGDMIYGINHTFPGFNCWYGGWHEMIPCNKSWLWKWVWCFVNGLQPGAYNSCWKAWKPSLSIGSRCMRNVLSFGVYSFCLYAEGWPWKWPPDYEVNLLSLYACTMFGLQFDRMAYSSSPSWFLLAGAERNGGVAWLQHCWLQALHSWPR